jgi:hypothetical protein
VCIYMNIYICKMNTCSGSLEIIKSRTSRRFLSSLETLIREEHGNVHACMGMGVMDGRVRTCGYVA